MSSTALIRPPASPPSPSPSSLFLSGRAWTLVIGLAALVFLARLATVPLTVPLWLDENFSAAIASQQTFGGLVDWCLNELSGPLYYSLLWAWEKLAGNSNLALRLPTVAIFVATPALLLWQGHRDRSIRVSWALLVALWPLGFDFAALARPYALMVLLGCAQAICFLRLLEDPTTRRAAIWAGVSSLAVLTHYHAAVISGVQGLLFLLIWRGRAVRTWPALAVLLPMAAWMSWHIHVVLGFATSGQTWYSPLTFEDALLAPLFLLGSLTVVILVVALLPVALRWRFRTASAAGVPALRLSPELALIASGVLAATIVMGVGFFWPSVVMRYLLPDLGAVALLLPVLLRTVQPFAPGAPIAALLVVIGSMVPQAAGRLSAPNGNFAYNFNYEQPTDWILRHGHPRRLVFLWDNPTALLARPDKMADVGGFFFRRAGHAVEVLVPHYAMGADPYPAVSALAAGRADTAVIWSFDRNVPNTSALRHPVGVLRDAAHWTCRDFGGGAIQVLACLPKGATGR